MKRLYLLAILFLVPCLAARFAQADDAAPALFGVGSIVIQYATFFDPEPSGVCGEDSKGLARAISKVLQDEKMPAVLLDEARPPTLDVSQIELVPEVFTVNEQNLDCTSLVFLTAISHNSLRIPPLDVLRDVHVIYWKDDSVVNSGRANHGRMVGDALQKMAQQFAQRYRLDQPPDVHPSRTR